MFDMNKGTRTLLIPVCAFGPSKGSEWKLVSLWWMSRISMDKRTPKTNSSSSAKRIFLPEIRDTSRTVRPDVICGRKARALRSYLNHEIQRT
ncbi:hypothetical protein KIN20_032728 [Parelaphostrongylus tenuis]|uniref:Uncharacterized protein n=1 Tax=Parelaphostrongylus tenuis TaxID=148309 RepID=A0AAD5R9C2_PARTN|nr:hypothetical protein KIN20_032728 [Parelaphostrongylus tenuis]